MPVMALVYLDDKGHLWSPNRDLLHAFAAKIGLKREWFQDRPRLYHYDAMTPWRRRWALKAGAFPVSSRDLIRMIQQQEVVLDFGDGQPPLPIDAETETRIKILEPD